MLTVVWGLDVFPAILADASTALPALEDLFGLPKQPVAYALDP